MSRWLKKGGVMSHQIDMSFPGGAEWNHHWHHSDGAWRVARGIRSSFANRVHRWTANAEGQTLPITANADGLILISAPTKASDIQLNFEPPTRVRLFEMVTLISWILISGSFLKRPSMRAG